MAIIGAERVAQSVACVRGIGGYALKCDCVDSRQQLGVGVGFITLAVFSPRGIDGPREGVELIKK